MMLGLRGQTRNLTRLLAYSKSNGQPGQVRPFNPTEHGLPADFILTNYTKMKG